MRVGLCCVPSLCCPSSFSIGVSPLLDSAYLSFSSPFIFVYVSSFISPPSLSLFCHYTRLRSSTPSKTLRRDFSSFTPERTKPVTFIGSATNFSPLPASLSTQSRFRVHFFVVSPFAVLCGLCHFLLPECVARSLSLFLFLFLF